jgi:hypothetical protein
MEKLCISHFTQTSNFIRLDSSIYLDDNVRRPASRLGPIKLIDVAFWTPSLIIDHSVYEDEQQVRPGPLPVPTVPRCPSIWLHGPTWRNPYQVGRALVDNPFAFYALMVLMVMSPSHRRRRQYECTVANQYCQLSIYLTTWTASSSARYSCVDRQYTGINLNNNHPSRTKQIQRGTTLQHHNMM